MSVVKGDSDLININIKMCKKGREGLSGFCFQPIWGNFCHFFCFVFPYCFMCLFFANFGNRQLFSEYQFDFCLIFIFSPEHFLHFQYSTIYKTS